jgi:DNA-binding CsgD family transcriptional regulator
MFVSSTRLAVLQLCNDGLKSPEIARRLNVAPATVLYHLERLAADDATVPDRASGAVAGAHEVSKTREAVAELLAQGISRIAIARRLNISKATVSYHARRLDQPINDRFGRRYDWAAVQRYYDEGHSVRECIRAFGFSSASWSQAVRRGAIVARPAAIPIAELLVENTYRGRFNLKIRLLKEGLKDNRCEGCGLTEWREAPITLALHHINGRRNDNRLENLSLLCPNCHSQTENYAGRNGRAVDDEKY